MRTKNATACEKGTDLTATTLIEVRSIDRVDPSGRAAGRPCPTFTTACYGQRFVLRAGALEEAEAQRRRLMGEGWASE
jgi:hypothetical protein